MTVLHIDFETYSSVDLKKYGMHKYVESPDFEILMMAYAVDDGPVDIIDICGGERVPEALLSLLTDGSYLKKAHNAPFEIACIERYFGIRMAIRQWQCTAVHCAQLGLPRSLGEVSTVLKLPSDKAKQSIGRSLITYFCKPCKPTKVNGKRTRNLPHHNPEKWDQFKEYCCVDVEAEREVDRILSAIPVPQSEWDIWYLDQQIVNRGAMVDLDFVRNAVRIGAEMKDALMGEAREITGLDNPNSLKQLISWLNKEMDEEVESLTKADVKKLLKDVDDDTVQRVLEIRQNLGKTSTKKYDALLGATCADSRIRGTLLFYGASRTGRWAGRVFQPQNLPQNHLDDIDTDREIFKTNSYETLSVLYDSVADTASQLIRTAIVAPPGKKFIVVDFSAVEARGLAYLAGEEWRLEVFRTHGKIYEASASAAFHVPMDQIGKGSPLRQQGKVLELACLAEGTMVITSNGLKKIENVRCEDMVWDGVEWVNHDGVILRGHKEVITYEGLTATPDHLVWVEGKQEPIRFKYAASRGLPLLRTGDCGKAVRVGEGHKPGKKVEQGEKSLPRTRSVPRVLAHIVGHLWKLNKRYLLRLPSLFSKESHTTQTGQEIDGCETKVHESERQRLQELRCEGYPVRVLFSDGGGIMDTGESRTSGSGHGHRPDRQQRKLRSRKSKMVYSKRELRQQKKHSADRVGPFNVAILSFGSNPKTQHGYDQRRNTCGCEKSCRGETEKLEGHRKVVPVYDILNAGPRHRFTASDVLVHNCGYGGSVGAIDAMDKNGAIPPEDRKPMVDAWRRASPKIVNFWWEMGGAAIEATENPGVEFKVGKHGVSFKREKGFLFMRLPSGRRLAYPRPMIQDGKYGPQLTFEGVDQYKKTWGRIDTYGPKLVENLTQAFCRDLLACGMQALDRAGYDIVFHVHDEAVVEVDLDVTVAEVEKVFAFVPKWAEGMPHKADGFETYFYKKD